MIPKTLWIVAAMIGSANLLMFAIDGGLIGVLSAGLCAFACGLTYKDIWR